MAPLSDSAAHIDTDALRRDHPTAELVASYGIELRRSGAALIGRCPFHNDGGRPNLYVYRSGRWICYRCGESGDVIGFLQRIENLSFREAAGRLMQGAVPTVRPLRRSRNRRTLPSTRRTTSSLTDEEVEVLSAATDLYASRLMHEEHALAYLAGRGFPRAVLERYRLGYSSGDELVRYLQWRRLPVPAAMRVGLVRKDGREFMAGRITMPEFRSGRPVWLIGRLFEPSVGGNSTSQPKYLGLPGPKPLLGWDHAARDLRGVCLVEGPLDLLTLRMWGVPGIALAGSASSHDKLQSLRSFDRVYLALDQDKGGREASDRLCQQLGTRAVRIELPGGVKDVADLANDAGGDDKFRRAILRAVNPPDFTTRAA
ncbi:MAG: toprim domain-containing protein [Chloroflexi bacterium]|nr:toprim domain-containing protein [Chloroflexota bacterium]MBV9897624.1 toprim domain-containing protein [Chloroflexota bacterium]